MADRKDPTEITPKEPEYDIDKVDNRIVNYTKQIREKMHLEDVTESMARVAELAGLIATESKDTAEYIKEFMDDVQIEWNANPNKDPEIISARGGAAQLKDRFENTDRQLAQTQRANEKTSDELSILGGELGELNAINSWWTGPLAIEKNNNVLHTYTDNKGGVWINKHNKITQEKNKYRVISNEVDDHNAPNILILKDGRLITFYSRHNKDQFLRYRISQTPYNLDFGEEEAIGLGQNVTYAQGFVEQTTGNVYVFTRVGSNAWKILMSEDNFTTVALNKWFVNFGEGNQGYMKIKYNPTSNLVRFAFSGHPTIGSVHSIYYCYMNTQGANTGNIVSGGSTLRNVLSETWESIKPHEIQTVYDSDATGKKARLFDIGTALQIVFCEFTTDTDGVYKMAIWNGSGFDIKTIVSAGQTFGGGSQRFYYGGMICDSLRDSSSFYLSRFVNDKWVVERWHTSDAGNNWTSLLIDESEHYKLIRPHTVTNSTETRVLYSKGDYAEDGFSAYDMNLISR